MMAIVNFISCQRSQTVGGLNGVINYCCQKSKTEYEGRQLVSGVNCVPQFALQEFMNSKRLHKNTGGRMYYHMIQSFHPSEQLTPEVAHEIALKLAEEIPGFEIVVATHTDRAHIHTHFIINSVNCETGKKYHSNLESLNALRAASDRLCKEYNLSVVQPKQKKKEHRMNSREYRAYEKGDSWKMDLEICIDECMTMARDREHFFKLMEWSGYGVRWTKDRKYITYTTPEGHRCRDIKLNGRKSAADMRAAQKNMLAKAEAVQPTVAVMEPNWRAIIASQKEQVDTLGDIMETMETLITKEELVEYMDRQLQTLTKHSNQTIQIMEDY